jgi:hypothetical protein
MCVPISFATTFLGIFPAARAAGRVANQPFTDALLLIGFLPLHDMAASYDLASTRNEKATFDPPFR